MFFGSRTLRMGKSNTANHFPQEGRALISALLEKAGTSLAEFTTLPADRRQEIALQVKEHFQKAEVQQILKQHSGKRLDSRHAQEIRHQLEATKWTSLPAFVAYVSALLSQFPETERAAVYQRHAQLSIDSNHINRVGTQLNKLQPLELDDFVRGQSSFQERAFIELITNAMDALPGSAARGRFGIGFYQTFALLNRAEDSLKVTTSHGKGNPGQTLRFRSLQGKIEFSSEPNKEATASGTAIEINSSSIQAIRAGTFIRKYLQYVESAPIYLNGELINSSSVSGKISKHRAIDVVVRDGYFSILDRGCGMNEQTIFQDLLYRTASGKPDWATARLSDQSKARFKSQGSNVDVTECQVALLVGEVLVEEFKVRGANLPKQFSIDFPTSLALTEARDRIIVDQVAVKVLRDLVDRVVKLKAEEALPICNVLLPIFKRLKLTDEHAQNDETKLLNHLRDQIKAHFPKVNFLPNRPDFLKLDLRNSKIHLLDPDLLITPYQDIKAFKAAVNFKAGTITTVYQAPFLKGKGGHILDQGSLLIDQRVDLHHNLPTLNATLHFIKENAGNFQTQAEVQSEKDRKFIWKVRQFSSLSKFAAENWEALGHKSATEAQAYAAEFEKKDAAFTRTCLKQLLNKVPAICYLDCWEMLQHCLSSEQDAQRPALLRKLCVLGENLSRLMKVPEIYQSLSVSLQSPLRMHSRALSEQAGTTGVLLLACAENGRAKYLGEIESPFNAREKAHIMQRVDGAVLCASERGDMIFVFIHRGVVIYNEYLVSRLEVVDSEKRAVKTDQLTPYDLKQIESIQYWLLKLGHIDLDSQLRFGWRTIRPLEEVPAQRSFKKTYTYPRTPTASDTTSRAPSNSINLQSPPSAERLAKYEEHFPTSLLGRSSKHSIKAQNFMGRIMFSTTLAGTTETVFGFQKNTVGDLLDREHKLLSPRHIAEITKAAMARQGMYAYVSIPEVIFKSLSASAIAAKDLPAVLDSTMCTKIHPALLEPECLAILNHVQRDHPALLEATLDISGRLLFNKPDSAAREILLKTSNYLKHMSGETSENYSSEALFNFTLDLEIRLPKRMNSTLDLIRNNIDVPASEIPENLRAFYLWMTRDEGPLKRSLAPVTNPKSNSNFKLTELILWARENEGELNKKKLGGEKSEVLAAKVQAYCEDKSTTHINREIAHTANYTSQQAVVDTLLWCAGKQPAKANSASEFNFTAISCPPATLEVDLQTSVKISYIDLLQDLSKSHSRLLNLLKVGDCVFTLPVKEGSIEFKLRPVIRNNLVVDAEISVSQVQEPVDGFKLTLLMNSKQPEVSMRQLESHLISEIGLVPLAKMQVKFNGTTINYTGTVGTSLTSADGVQVQTYRESGFRLTRGGVFLRNLRDEDLEGLPGFILQALKKENTLVIDLPADIAIIRSGNEVKDLQRFQKTYGPVILQAAITSYCSDVIRKRSHDEDPFPYQLIPYDYFSDKNIQADFFQAEKVAAALLRGNLDKLTQVAPALREPREILFYLPLFEIRDQKYSLDQLRQNLMEHKAPFEPPVYKEDFPPGLRKRLDTTVAKVDLSKSGSGETPLRIKDTDLEELLTIRDPKIRPGVQKHFAALRQIHQHTTRLLANNEALQQVKPDCFFYYSEDSSIAHANRGNKTIAWNLYHLVKDDCAPLKAFVDLLNDPSALASAAGQKLYFDLFLHTASHEAAHLLEQTDESTHHERFLALQADVLINYLAVANKKS